MSAAGRRVVVVGAGLGGLGATIALRAAGVDTVTLERAPTLGAVELGAGITLWPNAVLALDKLGVGDEVRRRGAILHTFEQRTHHGRFVSRWPLDRLASKVAPVVGINRTDLHSLLSSRAGEWVQTGSEVTDISDDGEQARAVVADGREEAGDVLVGADGVWSLVRKRILSDAPPRYSGLTMWRANLDVDEAEMPLVDFTAWWGRAAKLVYFRSGPTRISWEAIVASEADGRDAPGQSRAAVLERFAGFPELGLKIVEATDPRAIFRTDVYDRPPDARWGQGRVTLLGDAAHPMTFAVGQGAAQALEDGLALTDHLTGTGDVEQALRAYEAERIARAAHFQTLAWKLARAGAVRNPAGCLVRNTVFRIGNPIGFRMQFKETVLPDRTQGAAL